MLLLFLGMLIEFRLDAFARNTGRGDGVHCVPQHAYDFGRENALEDLDRLIHVTLIGGSYGAFSDAGSRLRSQLRHVCKERLIILHSFVLALLAPKMIP